MASEAKYEVFAVLLEDMDRLYADLRQSCANLESIEQPTITPLSYAVQGIHEYKIQLESLRRIEQSALELLSVSIHKKNGGAPFENQATHQK